MTAFQLQSTITCPQCHQKTTEQMPTDYCQYIWECPHFKNKLKPKKGVCCVIVLMEALSAPDSER